MPLGSFVRDIKVRVAAWSIPKLKSWLQLGRPILAFEYLRTEIPMPKKIIVYRLRVTSPIPDDVVRREVSLTVDGEARPAYAFNDGDEVKFPDAAVVSGFSVDFDRSGNASPPSPTVTFTAAAPDTEGPGQPTLMFEFVRVETEDDPAPTA
jgi:hypothetical protein